MNQHLVIDNENCTIKIGNGYLQINMPDRPSASIPFHLLSHITFVADIPLTTHLIHRLSCEGVNLTFMNQRGKFAVTDCFNLKHGNYQRRLLQYKQILDEDVCSEAARLLIRSKINCQIEQIRKFYHKRTKLRHLGKWTEHQLHGLKKQCKVAPIASLLGIEGTASRLYFSFYAKILPAWVNFTGRNKRPPKDPVNALLSLAYSMLTSECKVVLQKVGLDPSYGFYHQITYSRPSLACDLVELFRHHADQFVWRLISEQKLKENHFGEQNGACLLKKEGRSIFYSAYYQFVKELKPQMQILASKWYQVLMPDTEIITLTDLH